MTGKSLIRRPGGRPIDTREYFTQAKTAIRFNAWMYGVKS
jgi:hypothetical protein